MPTQLSPFVHWAQTNEQVRLRVELLSVKNPLIEITTDNLLFKSSGIGARGENEYTFNILFYNSIDIDKSFYKINSTNVDFTIIKKQISWWPRVTAQPQKPHWLKIDFERWKSEDEQQDDINKINDDDIPRDIMKDYPGMYDELHKQEYGYRKEQGKLVYLIFYNLSMFIGFIYILIVIGIRYYRDGNKSVEGTYTAVGDAFKFCQLLQYLEVMHPLFGYTKGSPLLPFIQITGRAFVLFLMIDQSTIGIQTKPVVFYLFLCWSLIEVIRYPYYIISLLKRKINLITWLRYTIWIPLFPLGVLFESVIILRHIPHYELTQRYSIQMPNIWNFTFDMSIFLKIYIFFFIIPGFYFIMNHLSTLRRKKLGGKHQNRLRKEN